MEWKWYWILEWQTTIWRYLYKEGKRWNGKWKDYDSSSRLTFEGEYKEGKEYNYKGNLIIKREYNEDKIERKVSGMEKEKNMIILKVEFLKE